MARETITVRMDLEKRRALDDIAALLDRDRSHVINEAVSAYIDLHEWQLAHIHQGLREADEGALASEAEVQNTLQKLRRR